MRLNIVGKREAPIEPYTGDLICNVVDSIPFCLGALNLRSQKYWWATPEDQKNGRRLLYNEGANMLLGCGREITNRQDALYNLLDATLRGTLRDVEGTGTDADPYIYEPEIPQTVDPVIYTTPSLQYNSVEALAGIHNLTDGQTATNFADTRNFRQTLDDILAALNAETNEETIDLLQKIAVALGAVL